MNEILLDGGFLVTSNTNCWVLHKEVEKKEDKPVELDSSNKSNEKTYSPLGYYTSLESLFKAYSGYVVRGKDIKTVKELLSELKNVNDYIKKEMRDM